MNNVTFLIFFALIPFANHFIYLVKNKEFKVLLLYFFNYLLYSSMIVSSISTLLKVVFGKKVKFIITPKDNQKYSIWDVLKYNWLEIFVLVLLIVLLSIFTIYYNFFIFFGWLWIIFLIIPLISTPFLTLLSNKKISIKWNCHFLYIY